MKVLIIGGHGYIGTALVDYIRSINKSLSITVVDTENYNSNVSKHDSIHYINGKYQDLPKTFFEEFTDIILLAGQGSVSNSKNILNVIDNNVRNFAWLTTLLNKDQKLIYASSSSVYGRTDNKDVTEDFCKTSGYEPYNYYDWSKQNIDQLCELNRDNLQFYGLRFGTVNGFSRNLRNDVMINSMCFNAKKNGKIFVSKNNVNRPILGIDDLCKAIVTIMYKGSFEKSGLYNLNSFNAGLFEIATSVSKICNVNLEEINNSSGKIINFKLQTKSYDFKIDSSKFIKTFGFSFKDTLESITNNLLYKWGDIQNFQNRLDDAFINYKIITKCRVCNNKTTSLLNLGNQPLANNYTKFSNTLDYNPVHVNIEESYPLHLHYCEDCFHVQLNCIVNPSILFKNYVYISGTSKTLRDYFEDFAMSTLFKINYNDNGLCTSNNKEIKVLDIATNDASQLDAYYTDKIKEMLDNTGLNLKTIGVDPAVNIYENISSHKKHHDIYCDFFNENVKQKIKQKYNVCDIIIAQNVFAHTDNVHEFLQLCKDIMDSNSKLYIQTSQKNMILENQFDTAYSEHLSFFNINSMNILCEKNGLYLNNVFETDIHGTSYLFEIAMTKDPYSNIGMEIYNEQLKGLYDKQTYIDYGLKCMVYKNNLHNKLIQYKLDGKNIIGYGSTAKGNVVLNYSNIDSNIINYIIDENELKQNLHASGSNIFITDISALKNVTKDTVILVIAWNFYDEIKNKIILKLNEYNVKFPIEIINMNSLISEIIN